MNVERNHVGVLFLDLFSRRCSNICFPGCLVSYRPLDSESLALLSVPNGPGLTALPGILGEPRKLRKTHTRCGELRLTRLHCAV